MAANDKIIWPSDDELLAIAQDFDAEEIAAALGCTAKTVYTTIGTIYADGTSRSAREKPVRRKLKAMTDGDIQDAIDKSLQLNVTALCGHLGISVSANSKAEIKRRIGLMKSKSKITGELSL